MPPIHEILQRAGVVGAGGAGYPAHAKYVTPRPVHVTNAQESEPGYLTDKWIHKHHVGELVALYAALRAWGVRKVVVAAKQKDRAWFAPLEEATKGAVLDCTGKTRHDLEKVDAEVIFAYTDDRYAFGMENPLLLVVAGKKIPSGERPLDHGAIVSNSETLLNMQRALATGEPVTRKKVHVYGETPKHTFVDAPIGAPVADLLADAGLPLEEALRRGFVVADGGPGWYDMIDPRASVVTRRTNSLLVIDPTYADPTQKDVLAKPGKPGYPRTDAATWEQSPREVAVPAVRVPLQDNPKFKSVLPAVPCVAAGARVTRGETIARADPAGLSVDVHAPFDGVVTALDAGAISIEAR